MNMSICVFKYIPKILPWLLLPFFVACSDQRSTYEIKGSAHSLTLIRETSVPWDKTAKYSIVSARMPDCMRKHPLPNTALKAKVEVFSYGNDAWIIRQSGRLFVTETRTCEGFTALDTEPEGGLGTLVGAFEMHNDVLTFISAPKFESPSAPEEIEAPVAATSTKSP